MKAVEGLVPASLTPFTRKRDFDYAAIQDHVYAVPTTDSKHAARLGARSWMLELANKWLMEMGNTTV